jgi:hypothetical protein
VNAASLSRCAVIPLSAGPRLRILATLADRQRCADVDRGRLGRRRITLDPVTLGTLVATSHYGDAHARC